MSEELIVDKCSPTMAGIKTGSLFTCPLEDKKILAEEIRRLNKLLVPRGVRIMPLRFMKHRVLIYMYRPSKLREDLSDNTAVSILSELQYPAGCPDRCVAELSKRLKSCEDFPHEIGLFLGYPPKDVEGFIKLGARHAKLSGVWKVYDDEDTARKKFDAFKKCTRTYRDAYHRHNSLDKLIVSC